MKRIGGAWIGHAASSKRQRDARVRSPLGDNASAIAASTVYNLSVQRLA